MGQAEREVKHAEITQEHGKFWLQIRHNLLNGTKAQVLQLLADHDAEVERKARLGEIGAFRLLRISKTVTCLHDLDRYIAARIAELERKGVSEHGRG